MRYEQAITDAAVAVTRASSGLNDESLLQLLAGSTRNWPSIPGLVEIARTNNRAGNPVGSSYLSEASGLMQSDDPARRTTALPGDLNAGGQRNHRIHPDPGSGDPRRRHHRGVRRALASLAGTAHQATDQSRSGGRRARYPRDGGVGRNSADNLNGRQP